MEESEERGGAGAGLPVLSVTKSRGPMLASERFSKVLHSRDLSQYRVARRGQVVADPMLLWDGSIGLQRVVDAGLVSPDYRVYQPRPTVDPQWLGYLVRSERMKPHYQGGARGTNVRRNRISRSDFLSISVLLPPLTEQRRIAAIVSSVDDAIERTEAVIGQVEVVKSALLTQLTRNRRAEVEETFLGSLAVQEGLQTGPFGSQLKASEYTPTGIPVVMPKDLRDQRILVGSIARVSEDTAQRLSRHRLLPGDILFARRGEMGRCALVDSNEAGWLCGTGCLRLRVNERVHPPFLVSILSTASAARWLTENAVGQTMLNLSTSILARMPIMLPPIEEQRRVAAALAAFASVDRANSDFLSRQRVLRSALLDQLLSGRLRSTAAKVPR